MNSNSNDLSEPSVSLIAFTQHNESKLRLVNLLVGLEMGRKRKRNGIRDVYNYDSETRKSTCLVCGKNVNGDHLGNLTGHLKNEHKSVYEDLDLNPEVIEPQRKKAKITLEFDPKEVLDAWVNLVIEEGRPFVLLDSPSLRYLIKPIFDALELGIITSHTISDEIKKRTNIIVQNITEVCANRMLSLKIDSATRHARRVMCINVQFVHNTELIVLTLAMKELNCPHKSENVKKFVLEVLER